MKRTLFDGMIIAEGITVVIFILTRLFPEQILRLFNDDEVFLELGSRFMGAVRLSVGTTIYPSLPAVDASGETTVTLCPLARR